MVCLGISGTVTSLFPHLAGAKLAPEYASFEAQAKEAEFWETPPWAADAILRAELLTPRVWDPCCGKGVISDAALRAGYKVLSTDLHDWGYDRLHDSRANANFLDCLLPQGGLDQCEFTIFMNPPFSKAVEFVEQAQALGARKIVCFQRFAWFESDTRYAFWRGNPPQRIYVCADRATCWLGSVPPEDRTSGTTTAHAWFVWERGQPAGPLTWHVRKRK